MKRFICPELTGDIYEAFRFGLCKSSIENLDSLVDDGEVLPQIENIFDARQTDRNYYSYANTAINEYFEFRSLDGTVRTISGLATARGITINTNFGTFTKEFSWHYNRLMNLQTNIWYTVFDGDGELHFLKPERDSNSSEITNYDILLNHAETDKSVNYEGESGADFTIAVDTRHVIPTTVDSTIKEMTVNKYNSGLHILTLNTTVDVAILDYVIVNGSVFVILSKKLIPNDRDELALYECIAVKEVADSLSFSGADVSDPSHYVLSDNVPQKNYSVKIRQTSVQAIPANVATKLNMHSTDFNRNTNIFTVDLTNNRIKVLKAGVYQIIGTFSLNNVNDGQRIACLIYKNGAVIIMTELRPGAVGYYFVTFPTIVECSVNDYIELYQYTAVAKNTFVTGIHVQPKLQVVLLELD